MPFDFRWRIVVEQLKPALVSFDQLKNVLGRHTAIAFKDEPSKTLINIEYQNEAAARAAIPEIEAAVPAAILTVDQIPCYYCGALPVNRECHVVSKFMIDYIRSQGVDDTLFYTWNHRPFAHSLIAPPYFCQKCENVTFGDHWENPFSQKVFPDPLKAGNEWGKDVNLSFVLLMCYRYAIHCLVVDPNSGHQPIGIKFRDLAFAALQDLSKVGKSIFIYPYVYQPITATCSLNPGINAFLNLGFHDRYQLAKDGLPDCYFIQLPKMILLFSDADLTKTNKSGFANLIELTLNKVIDPKKANAQIPELYHEILNEGLQATMNDQTSRNAWFDFVNPSDQQANPDKMTYIAHASDQELNDWQQINCK